MHWLNLTLVLAVAASAPQQHRRAPMQRAAPAQTDWYCETGAWTRTIPTFGYSRSDDDPDDNFRVRIVDADTLRISGADSWANGNRRVRKVGSRYIFTDEVPVKSDMGMIVTPRGTSYFDTANGKIHREATMPYLFNMTMEMIVEGTCD